ncbi:MAG: Hsp20/alpha crystallin family protein, partial [Firmicutes bacterium]|nr:Hsp20/alpha crystallin family protein [Bacillota bacterium]
MMQTIPQGAEVFFADPFESLVRSVINPKTVATPAMDWSMDARAYYLDLDVPGMAREDLTIQTLDRQVRVRGERKVATPEGRTLLRRERPSGTWEH